MEKEQILESTNNKDGDIDSARLVLRAEQKRKMEQYQRGMNELTTQTGFSVTPGVKLSGGEEVSLHSLLQMLDIKAEPVLIIAQVK